MPRVAFTTTVTRPRGDHAARSPVYLPQVSMTVTRTFKAFKAFKASKASSNGVGGVSGRREDDDAQLEGDPKPRSSSTGLSQQARQVFQEAQENILALNRSRLRALEELKIANEKIADLEARLEEASRHISHLSKGGPSPSPSPSPSPPPSVSATGYSTRLVAQQTPTIQMENGNNDNKGDCTVTIVYQTGWDDAYLHFKSDASNGEWTQLPGIKLTPGENLGGFNFVGKKVVALPNCRNVEFVMTNGLGKFDTPNPYGEADKPKNYVINAPGMYELRNGQLHRLDS